MTAEEKTWQDIKTSYLRDVGKALSSVRHPRIKEVLADVGAHLERRFDELAPEERTWENFQNIITEMGPACDYAELLEPGVARAGQATLLKYLVGFGAAVVVVAAVLFWVIRPSEQGAAVTGQAFPATLNEAQKLYMDWTKGRFASLLDRAEYAELSTSTRKELEQVWVKMLESPASRKSIEAINSLAAIESEKATEPLLKIATDRTEKDNRDRWMATRALGAVGDLWVAPELIHLVYHYNQNTRFWAQISLVRLTGVNFGSDWRAWGEWWNDKRGNPPFTFGKVKWTSNAQCAEQDWQKEQDKAFIERLQRGNERVKTGDVQTYIVTFKPVEPFNPSTAGELLAAFNEEHPRGVRTHHYRTQVGDGKLVGHICVDKETGKDAVEAMLQASDKLIMAGAVQAGPAELRKLYAMKQVSLPNASAPELSSLESWVCAPLLDDETRACLGNFERYYAEKYRVQTDYGTASPTAKAAMLERWIAEVQGSDYDKAVRAAAALCDVEADNVASVLEKVATAETGSNRVKWIAVRGLAKMSARQAVPSLISLLDHHNRNVRVYARVALAEISGKFFGSDKQKWSQWWQQQLERPNLIR